MLFFIISSMAMPNATVNIFLTLAFGALLGGLWYSALTSSEPIITSSGGPIPAPLPLKSLNAASRSSVLS